MKHPGLGVKVSNAPGQPGADAQPNEEAELDLHERERVIELLLAQERVIAILYERTFPVTTSDQEKVKIDDPGVYIEDP